MTKRNTSQMQILQSSGTKINPCGRLERIHPSMTYAYYHDYSLSALSVYFWNSRIEALQMNF